MDRLIARIRDVLDGGPRRPAPPPPLPAPSPDRAELIRRFEAAVEKAAGRFFTAATEEEAVRLIAREGGDGPVVRSEDGPTEAELLGAETGIDRADVLVSETGTILRSYASREESRISLVPARSVFLATPEMLVATLSEALARVVDDHRAANAYTVLVTGPSRTADIEKELVIPAHGPRELWVILVG